MKPKPKRANLAFELALLAILALLWGSSYLWIKVAVATIPPLTLTTIRVAVAAIVLLVVVRILKLPLPTDWRTWQLLSIQAFFNSTGAWTILAWGQQFVDSGLAGVLNSTSPIFVLLITAIWTRHEPVTWMNLLGVAIGVGGIIMIIGLDAFRGLGHQVLAQIAVLTSAFLYALAAVFGKGRYPEMHPTVIAAGTMICATACLLPLSFAVEHPWKLEPSLGSLVAAVILGIFCTGLALLLYFRLLETLGSIGVASQAYLRAGLSVTLGVVVLGEQLTMMIAIGVVATILGVALINFPRRA
ncbi:MAG: DMT family transporter [Hyphomicrobiaceae bacterium]